MTDATLTAPLSRVADLALSEATEECGEAAAWLERARTGSVDAGQCAPCERTDGPFEAHHIAGRLNSEITVPACQRCHQRLSERQNGWDPRWQTEGNSPRLKETFVLRGLSDLCEERSRQFGPEYHRLAKRLRAVYAKRAKETI